MFQGLKGQLNPHSINTFFAVKVLGRLVTYIKRGKG